MITAVITEPEQAINHFKNTRKSGFVCITLLSHGCDTVDPNKIFPKFTHMTQEFGLPPAVHHIRGLMPDVHPNLNK